MKALFLSLTLLASALSVPAQADTVPARISYLNCGGFEMGVGSVSVIYTGGDFNITEVSPVGVTFTQQAEVVHVKAVTGKKLVFTLRGRLNNVVFKLEVDAAGQSRVSTENGSMDLTCAGDVQGI